MVGWHYQLNRHEFDQTLGDGEGQGSLACCSPRGCKELDMTQQWNKNKTKNKKTNVSHPYYFYSVIIFHTLNKLMWFYSIYSMSTITVCLFTVDIW